jgi:hypothetical protein
VNGFQQQPGGGRGSAQKYLNGAADAILALKSTRFSLKHEGTAVYQDDKTGITISAADCVYAAPDRVSCDVKVSLKNGMLLQMTRVWVPEGVFQSNPMTRQFAKMPPAEGTFNGAALFAKTGIPDILRTAVQNAQVVGREKIQNRNTLRLKGDVSGEKLNPLVGFTLKSEITYPFDLWIDEQSVNTMRIHVTEPDGNGWLVELSGTNEPVDVPTPQPPPARGPQ